MREYEIKLKCNCEKRGKIWGIIVLHDNKCELKRKGKKK